MRLNNCPIGYADDNKSVKICNMISDEPDERMDLVLVNLKGVFFWASDKDDCYFVPHDSLL